MAYLKAKTGRDRLKMRGKKKLSFWSIQTWPGIGNFKKIAKKLKKLKNINMASFQAKTGRERLRMWEKKILVLIHSNPTRNREFKKSSKKIQTHQYGFFSRKNGMGEAENVKKKKFSFWSILTRTEIRNSRKIAKKFKKLKNMGQAENERKKKNRSYRFPPNPELGIPKK